MEILNNLWIALTTENETLVNILWIPATFFEAFFIMTLFTSILHINASNKQKIAYVIIVSLIEILIIDKIFPSPFNTFANYIFLFIMIKIIFRTTISETIICVLAPTIIFALVGTLILNPYLSIFNLSYEYGFKIPIYRLLYLFITYSLIYIITFILKKINFQIPVINIFKFGNKSIILSNIFIGLFTLCINLTITVYYTDLLPTQITYCNFFALIAYLCISIYSLTKALKLFETTQELENAEAYNRTLTILHDNVRCFRHDFNNIVTTIGGYIKTDDIEGLKKFYSELEKDCKNVNNIASLNPNLINNPGIYNLLTAKYNKANSKSVEINLEVTLDLQNINMKIYDFSKILGILLDNAIEASSECDEKIVNIKFRHNEKDREQILIIENTYTDKNIDINFIFSKGISSKNNHSGLGLWEVNKIISKNNNIVLHTNNNDKYFSQELIIHY